MNEKDEFRRLALELINAGCMNVPGTHRLMAMAGLVTTLLKLKSRRVIGSVPSNERLCERRSMDFCTGR